MRRIVFPTGYYEALYGWLTLDFEWALLQDTWVQDETTQIFMADIAADEVTAPEYGRIPVSTPTVNIVLPIAVEAPGMVVYDCDDPAFGTLSGGETAGALVLYNLVTNDSDSPIVACYPIYYPCAGLLDADFALSANGAISSQTLC
jgi:hypothetical protein